MNHEFSLFVGVIQQHDVRSLLRLLGRAVTEDEVRSLMRGLDPLGDERLAWDTGPGRGFLTSLYQGGSSTSGKNSFI